VGTPERASSSAKPRILEILGRHEELNPDRGRPVLIAEDTATGQLFFCSASGLCVERDRANRRGLLLRIADWTGSYTSDLGE